MEQNCEIIINLYWNHASHSRHKCYSMLNPGGYMYVQCALICRKKIGWLMKIICDSEALSQLIFVSLVPIFYKIIKNLNN